MAIKLNQRQLMNCLALKSILLCTECIVLKIIKVLYAGVYFVAYDVLSGISQFMKPLHRLAPHVHGIL